MEKKRDKVHDSKLKLLKNTIEKPDTLYSKFKTTENKYRETRNQTALPFMVKF